MSQKQRQSRIDRVNALRDLEDVSDRTVDAAAWDPQAAGDPRHCLECGAAVSDGVRRVYGIGEDNHVAGCPECKTSRQMMHGDTVPGRSIQGPDTRSSTE